MIDIREQIKNDKVILGCCFKKPVGATYNYWEKAKIWTYSVNGIQVRELTPLEIEHALSLCNPESELVKQMKSELK